MLRLNPNMDWKFFKTRFTFFAGKDGRQPRRPVADHRQLNAETIPDRTPMPHPEKVSTMLAGSRTFAESDITVMLNQVGVDDRDIRKTAITAPFDLYECLLVPFGLRNGLATGMRLMKEVFRDLNGQIHFVYFDEVIIFASDNHQLVQHWTSVSDRSHEHKVILKPSKCIFGSGTVSDTESQQPEPRSIRVGLRRISVSHGLRVIHT